MLSECELSGYDFIYDNSPTNGRPGGTGFFIKNDIDYTIILKLSSPDCENVWIETDINGKKKVYALYFIVIHGIIFLFFKHNLLIN